MKTLHAKSPCCRARVQRFGQRRRRCTVCHKTWRIRKKKRGRKRKRVHEDLIIRFFEKRLPPLRVVAKQRNVGKDAIQLLSARSLKQYVSKHSEEWKQLLKDSGSLIAVVDGIWYYIQKQKYTIYVILLRETSANRAIILPPVIHPGHENIEGWQKAFSTLPKDLEKRIVVLVSDGSASLMTWVRKKKNWVVQRCHFHLIAAVQNYLTTGPRSPHREYALEVLRLVQKVLSTNDPKQLEPLQERLKQVRKQTSSRGLRRVLGGLMTDLKDYHTYLEYLELNLPTTTNSAESFIQCIRDLMYRCRGFRSLTTLQNWLIGLSIFQKTIRCNGKRSTKLNH